MQEPAVLSPPKPAHRLWWALGLAALAANKVRHALRPYHRPRPFSPRDTDAAAEYDARVWANWMEYLRDYLGRPIELAGKTILELGPGPDLGVAALALAAGADRYIAFDRFPLARATPWSLHERLLDAVLAGAGVAPGTADDLHLCVRDALSGPPGPAPQGSAVAGPLTYLCREDFDLVAADLPPADLIVSQAAFEHFDDPPTTIAHLTRLAAPGAVLLAAVDLQTHTPFLRKRDPLNIYRYSDRLYHRLSFPGSPNRARPADYVRWLTESGWTNVQARPLLVLDESYVRAVLPHLAPPFRDPAAQVECLTLVLYATCPEVTSE
ncbi:MAG: class I SAM-dependent methyltransferase [Phycisphaerae bacterium]|nr:class I SAM-dependent methyltransferase [Phycisphaerae bacterium]